MVLGDYALVMTISMTKFQKTEFSTPRHKLCLASLVARFVVSNSWKKHTVLKQLPVLYTDDKCIVSRVSVYCLHRYDTEIPADIFSSCEWFTDPVSSKSSYRWQHFASSAWHSFSQHVVGDTWTWLYHWHVCCHQ